MSKKQKTSTEIAVIGDSVPDALAALQNELKGLKQIAETQYKTGSDGKVAPFPTAIQNETSVETLIRMHSSVMGRRNAYNESLDSLSKLCGGSLSAPVFKENGSSAESIEADIALRIQVLSISERKAYLESLLEEAQGFLSKDDQFKMFQQKLASALSS